MLGHLTIQILQPINKDERLRQNQTKRHKHTKKGAESSFDIEEASNLELPT